VTISIISTALLRLENERKKKEIACTVGVSQPPNMQPAALQVQSKAPVYLLL